MTIRVYLGGFKFSHRQESAVPTPQELQQRFGPVQDIDSHENYVHFTLPPSENPTEAFKKIQAKYNGSVWKGSKVRLEVSKAPKKELICAMDINKKEGGGPRRLVRHCGDMQVVEDVSGKVRKGWVRSRGGRHVMQEIKIRKPDGKVKTVDVNALFKKNILTTFNDEPNQADVKSIWSAHGYDMKPPSEVYFVKEPFVEEKEEKETIHTKEAFDEEERSKKDRPDGQVEIKKKDGQVEIQKAKLEEKPQESKVKNVENVCKWSEAVNVEQSISFSLFPTLPEYTSTSETLTPAEPAITKESPVHQILKEEKGQSSIAEEPKFNLEFAAELPENATSVIEKFATHALDMNQWKRIMRPILRKDIKQQRKQHLRTQRKSRRTDK